jgi:cellulose biosynthesis protein BcsQ
MGLIVDALRNAKQRDPLVRPLPFRAPSESESWLGGQAESSRPYRVLTVASNKGGVGKTTLASNLPVFLRALREDLPVLLIGLDDQSLIDRMFEFGDAPNGADVADGLLEGSFRGCMRLGQFGVHYVPSNPRMEDLKASIPHTGQLRAALDATGWEGLVVIDTKSDLGILTRNAIAASDLVLVPVADDPSLREADKVFQLLDSWGMPRDRARVLLSMIDRRIKYRDGEASDVLGLLLTRIRERDYPVLESFVSRSPKIESLSTQPDGRVRSILGAAPASIVTLQLRHAAEELLKLLDRLPVSR